MEYLHGGYTLHIPKDAFPISTDSAVLAYFANPGKDAKVLDLGSGCGTLGVLLCADHAFCEVTGVELSEQAHLAAQENIARNQLQARLKSICADICHVPELFPAGSFDCCISNPPYFTSGQDSKTHPQARKEASCTLISLFQSAAWALKYGGDFFLVHKPERLAEIFAAAHSCGLEPKKLMLLRHQPASPVNLVLVQCRKGGKPGLKWEEQHLFEADGQPSDFHRNVYHLQEES